MRQDLETGIRLVGERDNSRNQKESGAPTGEALGEGQRHSTIGLHLRRAEYLHVPIDRGVDVMNRKEKKGESAKKFVRPARGKDSVRRGKTHQPGGGRILVKGCKQECREGREPRQKDAHQCVWPDAAILKETKSHQAPNGSSINRLMAASPRQ